MPSSPQARTITLAASVPARCPIVRGSPLLRAHLPLPSMIMPICRGMFMVVDAFAALYLNGRITVREDDKYISSLRRFYYSKQDRTALPPPPFLYILLSVFRNPVIDIRMFFTF